MSLSEVIAEIPPLHMVKMKTNIGTLNPDILLDTLSKKYANEQISTIDGLKIDFDEGWVHMRKSNTEPIIRVYAEASSKTAAENLGNRFMKELLSEA